jgi:hypothetical protein
LHQEGGSGCNTDRNAQNKKFAKHRTPKKKGKEKASRSVIPAAITCDNGDALRHCGGEVTNRTVGADSDHEG